MTRWAVQLLLRLSPSVFRERHAEELIAVHDQRAAQTRGGPSALWFATSEVMGAAVLVVRLHFGLETGITGARGGATMWETTRQDVRFAMRTLGRNPGFALVAIAVLALGIGANTAIFSAVNASFFRPLPFGDADRLVMLFETNPEFGWDDATAAPANVFDWRDQVEAFEAVSGYSDFSNQVTAFRDGEPVLLGATEVIGNFFSTLGVVPALGRGFRMDETWEGSDNVVVISHDLWINYFGADPDIVGKSIELSAGSPEIIGVMPEGFSYPSAETELWTVPGWATTDRDAPFFRRAHWVRAFARLKPDVTQTEADAQLQVVVSRLQEDYPQTNSVMGAGFTPMRNFLIKEVRTQLLVLLGAVGLLLRLLACTNVANLMLVRANDRTREIALRHALGAGRVRVARQMLVESGVLALLGGAAGLALGWAGVRAIAVSNPMGIDGATSLALDYRVVLFTLVATGLSGILFGTAPALQTAAGDTYGGAARRRPGRIGRAPWPQNGERARDRRDSVGASARGRSRPDGANLLAPPRGRPGLHNSGCASRPDQRAQRSVSKQGPGAGILRRADSIAGGETRSGERRHGRSPPAHGHELDQLVSGRGMAAGSGGGRDRPQAG